MRPAGGAPGTRPDRPERGLYCRRQSQRRRVPDGLATGSGGTKSGVLGGASGGESGRASPLIEPVAPIFGASPSANPVGRRKRDGLPPSSFRTLDAPRFRRAALAGCALALAAAGSATAASSGGAGYEARPEISAVKCTRACASHGRVQNGGALKVRGQDMSGVRRVVYLGGRGRSDDVSVSVHPTSDRSVSVKVPYAASTTSQLRSRVAGVAT